MYYKFDIYKEMCRDIGLSIFPDSTDYISDYLDKATLSIFYSGRDLTGEHLYCKASGYGLELEIGRYVNYAKSVGACKTTGYKKTNKR